MSFSINSNDLPPHPAPSSPLVTVVYNVSKINNITHNTHQVSVQLVITESIYRPWGTVRAQRWTGLRLWGPQWDWWLVVTHQLLSPPPAAQHGEVVIPHTATHRGVVSHNGNLIIPLHSPYSQPDKLFDCLDLIILLWENQRGGPISYCVIVFVVCLLHSQVVWEASFL